MCMILSCMTVACMMLHFWMYDGMEFGLAEAELDRPHASCSNLVLMPLLLDCVVARFESLSV